MENDFRGCILTKNRESNNVYTMTSDTHLYKTVLTPHFRRHQQQISAIGGGGDDGGGENISNTDSQTSIISSFCVHFHSYSTSSTHVPFFFNTFHTPVSLHNHVPSNFITLVTIIVAMAVEPASAAFRSLSLTSACNSSSRMTMDRISPLNVRLGFLPAMLQGGEGKRSAGAFLTAIEDVNQSKDFADHGIKLDYFYVDAQSSTLVAIKAMTDMYTRGVAAFIGPEDTCAYEAAITASWNLPMISYKCSEVTQLAGNPCPTFARTQPSTSKVSESIIAILKYFQWRYFLMVVGRKSNWLETADALKKLSTQHNITVRDVVYFDEPYLSGGVIRNLILETYENTHIYVFLGDKHAFTEFVRVMNTVGLTDIGTYVVIGVNEKPDDPSKRIKNFLFDPFETEEALTKEKVNAFRSVLLIAPRGPSNPKWDSFQERTRKYLSRSPFCVPTLPFKKNPVTIHSAYLYDAVWVYARALREVLVKGQNISDGRLIIDKIRARSFQSIQGHTVYIDKNGDAKGNYTVLSLQENKSQPFKMFLEPVGSFEITSQGSGIPKYRPLRDILWVTGNKPTGEPECGYDGVKCIPKTDWALVIVCSVVTTLLIMVGILGVRHYFYEQKLARLLWKIDYKDIVFVMVTDEMNELPDRRKKVSTRWSFLLSNISKGESPMNAKPFYKGQQVSVKFIRKKSVELTRAMKRRMQMLKEMQHDNINRFIGACVDPPNCCLVRQYCARNLREILENKDIALENMFISSLIADLIRGMLFIHDSEIKCHGNLKPSNCLVDSRWMLQITDFGLNVLCEPDTSDPIEDERNYQRLLYTAPELLRSSCRNLDGTESGDNYSFALILYEIHTRQSPWKDMNLSNKEVIQRICERKLGQKPFRPNTDCLDCDESVIRCIEDCWKEDPNERPDLRAIKFRLKTLVQDLKPNIYEHLMGLMEKHAEHLETIVKQRTIQLEEEKRRSENLLQRMLPKMLEEMVFELTFADSDFSAEKDYATSHPRAQECAEIMGENKYFCYIHYTINKLPDGKSVAETLKTGCQVVPEHYDSVTIYFSDIVGFTSLSAASNPMQVVDLLNDLYTCFDSIIGDYAVYKVETIGDAYMVVSGLPERNGIMHAGEIASMSLHLLGAIKNFRIRHRPDETLKLRIGIHSGSCVTGVVGLRMPRYCLFGDTVNTASRMESTGVALKVHCSNDTYLLLQELGGYQLEPRGRIQIKGKGYMHTYFVLGEDRQQRLRRLTQTNTKVLEEMCQSDTENGPKRRVLSQSEEQRYMPDILGTNRGCSLVDDVFLLSDTAEDCDNEHVKLLPYQESATYRPSLENELVNCRLSSNN